MSATDINAQAYRFAQAQARQCCGDWADMSDADLRNDRDSIFDDMLTHFETIEAPELSDIMDDALTTEGFPFWRAL